MPSCPRSMAWSMWIEIWLLQGAYPCLRRRAIPFRDRTVRRANDIISSRISAKRIWNNNNEVQFKLYNYIEYCKMHIPYNLFNLISISYAWHFIGKEYNYLESYRPVGFRSGGNMQRKIFKKLFQSKMAAVF